MADENEWTDSSEALLIAQAQVMVSHGLAHDGLYVMVLMRLIDDDGNYVDCLMSPRGARELGSTLVEFGVALPDWEDDPVE